MLSLYALIAAYPLSAVGTAIFGTIPTQTAGMPPTPALSSLITAAPLPYSSIDTSFNPNCDEHTSCIGCAQEHDTTCPPSATFSTTVRGLCQCACLHTTVGQSYGFPTTLPSTDV